MNSAAVAESRSRGNIGPWLDFGYSPEGDPPNTIFFGADPCWTPAREKYTAKGVPGSNHGKAVIPETCPECGGRQAEAAGDDPMGDSELVVRICARCVRAAGRAKDRLVGAKGEHDDHRPGRMASKVVGAPDRRLNAYVRPKVTAEAAAKAAQPNGAARFRPKGKPDEPKPKPPTMRQKLDGGMADVLKPREAHP